jgi:hypothetical protein
VSGSFKLTFEPVVLVVFEASKAAIAQIVVTPIQGSGSFNCAVPFGLKNIVLAFTATADALFYSLEVAAHSDDHHILSTKRILDVRLKDVKTRRIPHWPVTHHESKRCLGHARGTSQEFISSCFSSKFAEILSSFGVYPLPEVFSSKHHLLLK